MHTCQHKKFYDLTPKKEDVMVEKINRLEAMLSALLMEVNTQQSNTNIN